MRVLQWGRVLMGPETPPEKERASVPSCFNGAGS